MMASALWGSVPHRPETATWTGQGEAWFIEIEREYLVSPAPEKQAAAVSRGGLQWTRWWRGVVS